jgi:hypothetical protein
MRSCLLVEINVARIGNWRGNRQKAAIAEQMAINKGFMGFFAYILLAVAVNYRRKMFSKRIISCRSHSVECAIAWRQHHAGPRRIAATDREGDELCLT